MTQLLGRTTKIQSTAKECVPFHSLRLSQVLALVSAPSALSSDNSLSRPPSIRPQDRKDKALHRLHRTHTFRRTRRHSLSVKAMSRDSPLSPPAVSSAAAPEFSALRPAGDATPEGMSTSPRPWSRTDSPNRGLRLPASRGRATSHTPRLWSPRDSDLRGAESARMSESPLPHGGGSPTPRRKRRALLFRPRASQAPEYHASSAAFRHAVVHGSSSSKLTLTLSCGRVVELAPVPMGGNCGFVAVSWALLIAGRLPSNDTSGGWVRRWLASHVAAQASFYAAKLVEWRVVAGGAEEATASVKEFVRKVGEEGIKGHWLGEMWGFLEIFAIARAFWLNVELYTFDVANQKVRMYHQQNEGKVTVAMLFTGQAEGGHFDLLLPTRRMSDLWKPKLMW